MSADDLCALEFAPQNFIVPGYIVEGLTLFAGKPKVGKSWLLLHAAMAVGRGGFTLGDVKCAEGDVLYCGLEDNKRRLQRRLKKLLGIQAPPNRLRVLSAGEMPLLSQGGTDLIRSWIKQVKKANEPLCAMCLAEGKVVPAEVADHVERVDGDYTRFRLGKLQSLCKAHHERSKDHVESMAFDPILALTVGRSIRHIRRTSASAARRPTY